MIYENNLVTLEIEPSEIPNARLKSLVNVLCKKKLKFLELLIL